MLLPSACCPANALQRPRGAAVLPQRHGRRDAAQGAAAARGPERARGGGRAARPVGPHLPVSAGRLRSSSAGARAGCWLDLLVGPLHGWRLRARRPCLRAPARAAQRRSQFPSQPACPPCMPPPHAPVPAAATRRGRTSARCGGTSRTASARAFARWRRARRATPTRRAGSGDAGTRVVVVPAWCGRSKCGPSCLDAQRPTQRAPCRGPQIPGGRPQHDAERHRRSEGALPEGKPGEEDE